MAGRNTAEFLNNILLQQSNNDLPYAEDARWSIRQHVLDTVQDFPSLTTKLKNYQGSNGRPVVLILLEGTVPIYFRGVLYNIPVSIWVPEKYPRQPPYPFVTPTPDMIIKPNHSFVSSTGFVNTPYMINWRFPTSNLNELVHDMAILFGSEPPLFSKPPGWTPPYPAAQPAYPPHPPVQAARPEFPSPAPAPIQPAPVQQPALQPQPIDTVQMHNPLGPGGGFPSSGWPTPPVQPNPPQPAAPLYTKDQLQDSFRQVALATLSQRLTEGLKTWQQQRAGEVEEMLEVQATLASRDQELDKLINTLAQERNSLESNLNDLSMKRVEMESWLDEYEKKVPVGDIDPDAAIIPADTLSSQALEAHALDLAIEEMLYTLDKALQRGVLQPEVYLKQVRQLCRKQYYARVLGTKIAAQQQAANRLVTTSQQQAAMQRSLAMPQGDSWVSTGVLANPLTMR